MALTRSQLLMGNSAQGVVLPGQPQGVVAGGDGITILANGIIEINSQTIQGVMKLGQTPAAAAAAANNYNWPTLPAPTPKSQLTVVGTAAGVTTLAWDDSALIPWTAKGQLIVGTGIDTDVLFNVGSNTSILVADSASVSGLSYSDSLTSAILLATGTTLQRPTPAVTGQLRFNTTTKSVEAYDGVTWDSILSEADLLTGTFHLYVNPEIGEDTYITGIFDSTTVPVITNQQVTCGYSAQNPFKTIARAALETARITGPGTGFDPTFYDKVVIHVSTGDFEVDNSIGGVVSPFVDGVAPTSAQLAAFNSAEGGVILPRGVSVTGEDLRKSIIRPTFVPNVTLNQDTDRTSIFRVTGGSYFFNFTFKDKLGYTESHHLVDCFQFISFADLNSYYNKVQIAFGFGSPEVPANPGETEITAPQPPSNPTEATDGVTGSSPYIFNCSIRSLYGLCGMHADGSVPTGFKSMVVAQFTGVSLQKDLRCWQLYNSGTQIWGNFSSYAQYIAADPNNVRMNPDRLSVHIRTLNGAVIQAVSVFAIGQGAHFLAQSGSDITITNSNSNFGGVSGLADGYRPDSFTADKDWVTRNIRVATNLTDNTNNVTRIYLGTVQSVSSTTITLTVPLDDSYKIPGQPGLVGNKGYTLPLNSLVWVENTNGNDWFSRFTSPGWTTAAPSNLNTNVALINQDGNSPGIGVGSIAIGKRVYVRRLADTRTPQQRRFSLVLTNPGVTSRNPLSDYVVQTQLSGAGISTNFPPSQAIGVMSSLALDPTPFGTADAAEIVISRRNTPSPWFSGGYYRPSDVVTKDNKHWLNRKETSSGTFNLDEWDETFVHTADTYYPPDPAKNTAPIILFDNDTQALEQSVTLGYNLTTVWSTDPLVYDQYRSSTDFKGLQLFLIGLGFSTANANIILTPLPNATRDLNPAVSIYGIAAPSGAANIWANWALQLRRPTNVRMFGHAWEWAGYLNYTKGLPQYQGDLSSSNKFTYYFTNANGGVVYASGFNEEGQSVTPQGLTNIATGETIAVENIGTGNLDFPTTLNNITLTGTTTINDALDLNVSSITWSPATYATTTQYGVVELGTDAEAAAGLSTTLVPTLSNSVPKDAAGMTGAAIIPAGTAAQAPAGPVSGFTRVNNSTGQLNFFVCGAYFPVGFGPGGSTSNTAVGLSALTLNTGTNNSAFGNFALANNTTGVSNTANGVSALFSNTTGTQNTANGFCALCSNTTGVSNTANGRSALQNNTTGTQNTANGVNALICNTTGFQNTANGLNALYCNTTGICNTANGLNALFSNTTGNNNTANGVQALQNNTTGSNNTANGRDALFSNTTGSSNTANGVSALHCNTTGISNTANGLNALFSNTTGSSNTANGVTALFSNTTGSSNTANGVSALVLNTTGFSNTAHGISALRDNTTGSGNVMVGGVNSLGAYTPVFSTTTENDRVMIGSTAVTNAYVQVAWTIVSDARDKKVQGDVPLGLEFVKQLAPKAYHFKVNRDSEITNGPLHYGFLAQDILALEGESSVIIDAEDPNKLRYVSDALIPVLVNAIKELATTVETLKIEVAELKAASA